MLAQHLPTLLLPLTTVMIALFSFRGDGAIFQGGWNEERFHGECKGKKLVECATENEESGK